MILMYLAQLIKSNYKLRYFFRYLIKKLKKKRCRIFQEQFSTQRNTKITAIFIDMSSWQSQCTTTIA